MARYSREIGIDLAKDLVELGEDILASLQSGPTRGPIVDDTCRRLAEAITSLVADLSPDLHPQEASREAVTLTSP